MDNKNEEYHKRKVHKRKASQNLSFCVKKERNTLFHKVSVILGKPVSERSNDEIEFLDNSKDIVKQISHRKVQRQKVKDRAQEYEDPSEMLNEKCKILAEAVKNSNHLVVYTGAGISTAACIPDYRGSNGIWTLLQQGKDIGLHDLSLAEPTSTHMALYGLHRDGILKHVVSQNCDGLHLRSGIPKYALSEVHGNMYLEVCSHCKPSNHYLRLFDVTEFTARYSHTTYRLCYKCGKPLKDTIVHFGERGKLQWPLNWKAASEQADKADVILCLGSSLKVLKKYTWLWSMDKPVKKRPKLFIVNLQWTPKDSHSTLKINGKCDVVISHMMSHLGIDIPKYVRASDPIFYHATTLHESEEHTTTKKPITIDLIKSAKKSATTVSADVNVITSSAELGEDEEEEKENAILAVANVQANVTDDSTSTADDLIFGVPIMDLSVSLEDDSIDCILSDENNDESNQSNEIMRSMDIGGSDKENDSILALGAEGDDAVEMMDTVKFIKVETDDDDGDDDKDEKAKQLVANNKGDVKVEKSCWTRQPYVDLSEFCSSSSLWSDLKIFNTETNEPILIKGSFQSTNKHGGCDSSKNDYNDDSDEKPNKSIACTFCYENYDTRLRCLFYRRCMSNVPLDLNSPCICCDGDTHDDDDEGDNDEKQQHDENEDDDEGKEGEGAGGNTASKVMPAAVICNPGWFGKGCKKKIRKRR